MEEEEEGVFFAQSGCALTGLPSKVTSTFLTFDPLGPTSSCTSARISHKRNFFTQRLRWQRRQMRANLADKHELVVAGCPLCDFNALSPVNGEQVTLVTEAVESQDAPSPPLLSLLLPANLRFLSVLFCPCLLVTHQMANYTPYATNKQCNFKKHT